MNLRSWCMWRSKISPFEYDLSNPKKDQRVFLVEHPGNDPGWY